MIDKKYWCTEWSEWEAKQIEELAKTMLQRGAISERAAWMAAEGEFRGTVDPYHRGGKW